MVNKNPKTKKLTPDMEVGEKYSSNPIFITPFTILYLNTIYIHSMYK